MRKGDLSVLKMKHGFFPVLSVEYLSLSCGAIQTSTVGNIIKPISSYQIGDTSGVSDVWYPAIKLSDQVFKFPGINNDSDTSTKHTDRIRLKIKIMKTNIPSWVAQIIIVVILGQTLFFKFTDSPETVELFAQLGMGAIGYKLIGFLELIACILLLTRPCIIWGALLNWGLMSGAIMAHVTKIGFEGPNGILGSMAIIAWLLSCVIIYLRRSQISLLSNKFGLKRSN